MEIWATLSGFTSLCFIGSASIYTCFDRDFTSQDKGALNWTHRSGNIRSIGSFTVDIRGTAKLKKIDSDYLQYEPTDIQAVSRYQERLIQEASGFPCSGQIIRRIEGSGNNSIDSIYPDMDKGSLLIGINRGNAGKIAAMQHTGEYNPMKLSKLDEMPPSDNYQVGLLVPLDVTYQQICSDHYTQKGKIPLYLVLFKDFTPGVTFRFS